MEIKEKNEINTNEFTNDNEDNNDEENSDEKILKAFLKASEELNKISTKKFKKKLKNSKKILKTLIKEVLKFRIDEEKKTLAYAMELIELITDKAIDTNDIVERLEKSLNDEKELRKQLNKINS